MVWQGCVQNSKEEIENGDLNMTRLKNWMKKSKENYWTNNKTCESLTVGKRRKDYWMIHTNKGEGWKAKYEGFKTKSQALKYAKAYMQGKLKKVI